LFLRLFCGTVWKNIKLDKMTAFALKMSADLFGSLEITLSAQLSFENLSRIRALEE
jgi:hypothetical protein